MLKYMQLKLQAAFSKGLHGLMCALLKLVCASNFVTWCSSNVSRLFASLQGESLAQLRMLQTLDKVDGLMYFGRHFILRTSI